MKARLMNCVPLSVMTLLGTPKRQTNPLKNLAADCVITFLKALGVHFAAVVAAQSLPVAFSTHSSPETIFLEEHGIILPHLLLLSFIKSLNSR
jgi:hypothetical protein